jgi:hypothetical protein
MRFKGHFKNALFALALASLNAPQAEATEIFTGPTPRPISTTTSLCRSEAADARTAEIFASRSWRK